DVHGKPTFHAYLHDISERQADKAKLAFALEEAREASRMKSAFLANMSHEIRTPMNGVLGMVGFLLDTELDHIQRDYVQTMAASAEALMAIIDDVLDVSKIEAGKLEIEESDFDLRRLLQDTLRPFMPAANEKGVALGATVSNSIPDAIRSDRLRLRQVISNLVSNAVKFTAIGSVNVCARVWDDKLLFEVTDTGIGIRDDRRAQLFEPFIQADASTTRRYGGTGLGLAICRQLITLMGGDIGVTAAQGGGSRFWFSVPLTAALAPVEPPIISDAQLKRDLRTSGQGRKVLVVEDNPVNRKVAVGMLEHLGYTVEIAVDGVEAASLFAPNTYDAILMDCQMPRMDGYDATRAIRAQESVTHTPIIAMTASAMASDRDKCLAAGMDDFLSKPIGTEKLGATLNNWIGESPPREATTTHDAPADAFDHDVAQHLRSLDDDGSFLLDLLTMFRNDSHALLQNLQDAIASGDTKSIRGYSHQLKGSTGLLGLRALSAACARVEHDHESVSACIGHMDAVYEEYDKALAYINDLAARTAA
ncbi:MAG: ATP-binding protein, partial [Acidimicrobiales bacterium]|nr:ATP-binding protein [Acidimicrobiales bacterium]